MSVLSILLLNDPYTGNLLKDFKFCNSFCLALAARFPSQIQNRTKTRYAIVLLALKVFEQDKTMMTTTSMTAQKKNYVEPYTE